MKARDTMEDDVFHNIKETSLTIRETFNNTIILLTMIKSDYYYIVGFSRPQHIIEIAFDFYNDLHSTITEDLIIDFSSDEEFVVLKSILKNITANEVFEGIELLREGIFRCDGNDVIYEYKIKKDRVIPVSFKVMHQNITKVIKEIISFEKECFENYLS